MRTELCDLVGIDFPLFQGGMAWVSTAELVSAVSEGGGLGIIGTAFMPPDAVRDQIVRTMAMTSRPFGVNVMLMRPDAEDVIQVLLENPVAVVTTGAGNPGKYVPLLKERGMKVIPVVPSVALAQRMERVGVDAVIAEGTEAGGHVGELTTMCLVPAVADAVSIPVIAAGGIIDGRGMAAALALGAKGVQMGTRFLCATETVIPQAVKDMVLAAKDRDTVVTARSTGHPIRVLKNKLSRELERLDLENDTEELSKIGKGKLKAAMVRGDVEWGSVMCGQGAALVRDVRPAAEIIRIVVSEAEEIIQKLAAVDAVVG